MLCSSIELAPILLHRRNICQTLRCSSRVGFHERLEMRDEPLPLFRRERGFPLLAQGWDERIWRGIVKCFPIARQETGIAERHIQFEMDKPETGFFEHSHQIALVEI